MRYILPAILILSLFFCSGTSMAAGDAKAASGKGVESVEPAKPTLKELQLEAKYLEEHFKVLATEQQATRQRYQEVQAEIKKIEGMKKEEKGKK